MTNVLIAGYYGLDNIGDEAILAGMVNSLKKYLPDAEISVITNNPHTTLNLHKVNPIEQSFKKGLPTFFMKGFSNGEFVNIYKAIDNCDVFILGGGSLLQDLKFYYLPALYSLLSLAQMKGKITVVYGIGAGPIDTKFGQELSKKILNNVDLVTVRDSMSKNVLESCGVKEVTQTIDPAFGMNIPEKYMISPDNKRDTITSDTISTTAYNWLHDSDILCNPSSPLSDLQYRRELMARIYSYFISEYDKKLTFIPTVNTDFESYTKINDLIPVKGKSTVNYYKNDFDYVFSLLSRTELLIGMRLHSLILSTMIGIPLVPVSYCGKVKSYLELLNMSNFYLDVENLGTVEFEEALISNFEKVSSKRGYYSDLLLDKAQKFGQIALENAKMVSELVQ